MAARAGGEVLGTGMRRRTPSDNRPDNRPDFGASSTGFDPLPGPSPRAMAPALATKLGEEARRRRRACAVQRPGRVAPGQPPDAWTEAPRKKPALPFPGADCYLLDTNLILGLLKSDPDTLALIGDRPIEAAGALTAP